MPSPQIFHPKLNNNIFADVAWTTSVYLEAVAVLPQLFMFTSQGGEIEAFISHWVFCIGGARIMHLVRPLCCLRWVLSLTALSLFFRMQAFWVSSYHELNDRSSGNVVRMYPGHLVVIAQVIQLILMLDFFYYYIKSLKTGGPMMLPVSARVEV